MKKDEAFTEARIDMEVRGAYAKEVETITMDSSTSTIKGAQDQMTQVALAFDRFHITEKRNEAVNDWRIAPLRSWMKLAKRSKLEPILKFVAMLNKHWYGIKSYFKRLATNAYAERVNLKIQEIKRIAKGFGNPHNFMTMIYFHLGGLDLKPTE